MKKISLYLIVGIVALLAGNSAVQSAVIDFSDLNITTSPSQAYTGAGGGRYYNGSDSAGSFTSGSATFNNNYNTTYGSWGGWAYSNTTNAATGGYANQYSAITGGGVSGSGSAYAVAYYDSYTPTIPTITFAADQRPLSLEVTNTAYAYYAMLNGDTFSKKFGGATGNDQDWFLLTITGYNSLSGQTGVINVYLADYRFSDNAQDYILATWETVDLSSFGSDTTSLQITTSSSDTYGTPSYFAVGNITTVPEPSSLALLLMGSAAFGVWRRRKQS